MASVRNRFIIVGATAMIVLTGLLAGCGSGSGSPSNMVSQSSPHYEADVALCGDNPSNMDWGTVQSRLGGATPALARLVSTWYGDFGEQQTMRVTGDTSGSQGMTGKLIGDGVAVTAWCRTNLAGWSS